VDPAALKKLQVLEGEEIDLLFQLHERIKKVIRASSDTSFLKQGNG
jgi:hypothetical protein